VTATASANCPTMAGVPNLAIRTTISHWQAAYTTFPTRVQEKLCSSAGLPRLVQRLSSRICCNAAAFMLCMAVHVARSGGTGTAGVVAVIFAVVTVVVITVALVPLHFVQHQAHHVHIQAAERSNHGSDRLAIRFAGARNNQHAVGAGGHLE